MFKSVEVIKGVVNVSVGLGVIVGVIKMEIKGVVDFIFRGKNYVVSGVVSFYINFGD